MPVSGDVPWEKAPHTDAKHRIYESYLSKWFPILLSDNGYPSVTYAEGFAGPGVYRDGSAGSPIIAIETLVNTPELKDSKKVSRFVFIDDDPRCTAMLESELLRKFPTRPRGRELMPVRIERGTCSEKFAPTLDAVDAWNQPILAVLDSWGNAPVPFTLMRRLAQNPSSEVIVTLAPQHFIRFVSTMRPEVDEVFGHDKTWRSVIEVSQPAEKKRFLLARYRQMLTAAGFRFLLDFELVTKKGESLYLIFGTNHRRGLEKMKQSVWEVDKYRGVGFRDPKDELEQPLFDLVDPDLAPLERLLTTRMHDGKDVRVETLREWTLFSTVYREQHVIPALMALRTQGKLNSSTPRLMRSSFVRIQR